MSPVPFTRWIVVLFWASAPATTCGASAATISPECTRVNTQALTLMEADRIAEVEAQLKRLNANLGASAEDQLCRGITLNNLSVVLSRQAKNTEAEDAASHSIDILEKSLGKNDRWLRRPLQVLASLEIEKGQFVKAEKLVSRAEVLDGATPVEMAVTNGLRAILAAHDDRLAEAESAGRQGLEQWIQAGLGDTLFAVPDMTNLACIQIRRGRTSDSIPLLERSLEILSRSPDNPTLRANALLAMGVAQSKLRNDVAAEGRFQEVLATLPNLPASVYAVVGRRFYVIYSDFLKKTGRKREAKSADEQAKAFGPDPSAMTVDISNLLPRSNGR